MSLQGFIDTITAQMRRHNVPMSSTKMWYIDGWTNVPTPASFRRPTTAEMYDPICIRSCSIELFVGLSRYHYIIKRMREWVNDKVSRMRDFKWAETYYAPPRSAGGGRQGGHGYKDARAEFNYNQGNNRITRLQQRRYGRPIDRRLGVRPY